jgi:hypothetical protein
MAVYNWRDYECGLCSFVSSVCQPKGNASDVAECKECGSLARYAHEDAPERDPSTGIVVGIQAHHNGIGDYYGVNLITGEGITATTNVSEPSLAMRKRK